MELRDFLDQNPRSGAELAREIGAHAPNVFAWASGRRPVPPRYAVLIERSETAQGLVRRWDLRPQDWWVLWPELIGTDGAPKVPEAKVA